MNQISAISGYCTLITLVVLMVISCQTRRNFSNDDLKYIGKLIFDNECSGKYDCLTSWNDGEEFTSLGIGHFIWYPEGQKLVYDESFPKFIRFISDKNADIPEWIYRNGKIYMPWKNRSEFIASFNSRQMLELRNFLAQTMHLQILFMIERMESVLPKILRAADYNKRYTVKKQFYRLYNSTEGVYVLIDYINFKGEGILKSESYNGYGWGLKQVLENMQDNGSGNEVSDFTESAAFVLKRRVINSPEIRNERRWLDGWLKRINSYKSIYMERADI